MGIEDARIRQNGHAVKAEFIVSRVNCVMLVMCVALPGSNVDSVMAVETARVSW
jgi:hypothetical protein